MLNNFSNRRRLGLAKGFTLQLGYLKPCNMIFVEIKKFLLRRLNLLLCFIMNFTFSKDIAGHVMKNANSEEDLNCH